MNPMLLAHARHTTVIENTQSKHALSPSVPYVIKAAQAPRSHTEHQKHGELALNIGCFPYY